MHHNQSLQLLKALADPTRLQLVKELAMCPTSNKSCGELSCEQALSQPAMSHHFAKLVASGVVLESKTGTHKKYQINQELLASHGIDPAKL